MRIAGRLRWTTALGALLALILGGGLASAEIVRVGDGSQAAGLTLTDQRADGLELRFVMESFGMNPVEVGSETMQAISLPGVFLPNDAGAPDLPGLSRFIAVPQGAVPTFEIVTAQTQVYYGVDVAPAPVIPRENDDSPLIYEKDPAIYGADALYPAAPVRISPRSLLRGVDVVTLGVMPFQYNPVTRELVVYTAIDIRVSFEGGNGRFGDSRFRTRYWEPILKNHLLNYASLEPLDFDTRGTRDGYEYIIICPDDPDFIAWADTLKTWRKLQGISTEVFTTSEVGTVWLTIEAFLNDCYQSWASDAFLLLGDYPFSGDGRDIGIDSPIWDGYCVSDNIYADVDGNNLPDMAHGRITARDGAELAGMVSKMLSYERDPYTDPGFYDHPVIAGGWQTERWFILCTEICLGHQANVLGKNPVREYAIYSGYPSYQWSTAPNTNTVVNYFGPGGLEYIPSDPSHLTDWGGNALRINNDLNAGAYMLLHRDHGYEGGWGEPNYNSGHLGGLHNTMYPFVFSINCLTGKYDWFNPCFTENFHRMNYGALGLVAASEISYSFVNDTFVWGMFDALWPDFMPGYPLGGDEIGAGDLRTAFAMASGKIFLEGSSWPYNSGSKIVTHHLFHHHGGAFMAMYSEVPQELSVSHNYICYTDSGTFTVTADAGALIGLTVDGEIIGSAMATGAPLEVPIIPQTTPGELRITITKANYYRYDVTIPVVATLYVVQPDGLGDFPTIQAAIDAADTWTLIELTDGVFTGDGNRDLDFLGKAIMVQSQSGDPAACIIDCGGAPGDPHRAAIFQGGETPATVLRGVTLRGGEVVDDGGAIACLGGSPTISGCIITDNQAAGGGAIHVSGASPVITACSIHLNTAVDGGAILIESAASAPQVSGCLLSGNEATGHGGALLLASGAEGDIEFNIFDGNLAALGGGAIMCDDSGSFSLRNNTIVNNDTPLTAGGLYVGAMSQPVISNNIVAFNQGGAMYCDAAALPTVGCNDFYGNIGGDLFCGIDAGFNISVDPLFCGALNPDDPYGLDYNSACTSVNNFDCGLIGARDAACGIPAYACCYGGGCLVLIEEDCVNLGGDWLVGIQTCDPDPCPAYACCIEEECNLLTYLDCLAIAGEWHLGEPSCDPNPCLWEYACCTGDDQCAVLTRDECAALGGDWLVEVESCDPNPCPERQYACCLGSECVILTEDECVAAAGLWQVAVASCDPDPCAPYFACCVNSVCWIMTLDDCDAAGGSLQWGVESCEPNVCALPDSTNLAGGALIMHAPPGLAWSVGEVWCQRYLDELAIGSPAEQINRIDPLPDQVSIWYVLAAWEAPKEWCSVEFGFGGYDAGIFSFYDWGACNSGGLEDVTTGWPGPDEGTAFLSGDVWSGNLLPVYWFSGYAYEAGVIPLGEHPTHGFAGFGDCSIPAFTFDATCLGQLGIHTDGLPCQPGQPLQYACCIGSICHLLTYDDCQLLGGEWQLGIDSCNPSPCASAIGDGEAVLPDQLFLSSVAPNPLMGPARITYGIPAYAGDQPVALRVFDAAGRVVRTLVSGMEEPGLHAVTWDGGDDRGQLLSGGIYFYQLRLGGEEVSRRVVIVR